MLTSQFTDQYKYLTSSIKFSYSDVKLISETQLYYLYEGKSKSAPYQSHTIRAFNFNSAFAQENYDAAASLFIKELLHLVSIDPTIVLVNTFEINDKKMAFAALTYAPISQITQNLISNKGTKEDTSQSEFSSIARIKDLISKVLLEVEYLSKELKIQDCSSILTPQSIYRCKESGKYFLGDWLTAIMKDGQMSTEIGTSFNKQSDAPVKPREILSLGLSIFELNRVNVEIIKRLREMEEKKDILFGPVVNGLFSTKELDGVPKELKDLLEMMVDSNESKRLKCIELVKHDNSGGKEGHQQKKKVVFENREKMSSKPDSFNGGSGKTLSSVKHRDNMTKCASVCDKCLNPLQFSLKTMTKQCEKCDKESCRTCGEKTPGRKCCECVCPICLNKKSRKTNKLCDACQVRPMICLLCGDLLDGSNEVKQACGHKICFTCKQFDYECEKPPSCLICEVLGTNKTQSKTKGQSTML